MTINNKLEIYRKASGKKQYEAAKMLGITSRQYRRIESVTPKAVEQFCKLAKFYRTTIDRLTEQPANGSPKQLSTISGEN